MCSSNGNGALCTLPQTDNDIIVTPKFIIMRNVRPKWTTIYPCMLASVRVLVARFNNMQHTLLLCGALYLLLLLFWSVLVVVVMRVCVCVRSLTQRTVLDTTTENWKSGFISHCLNSCNKMFAPSHCVPPSNWNPERTFHHHTHFDYCCCRCFSTHLVWWLFGCMRRVLWRWIFGLTDFMLPTVSNWIQSIWQQKFHSNYAIFYESRLPNLNFGARNSGRVISNRTIKGMRS